MGYPMINPYRGIYYLITHPMGYPIEIPDHPTNGRYFNPISHTVVLDGREVNIPHHSIPFRPLRESFSLEKVAWPMRLGLVLHAGI